MIFSDPFMDFTIEDGILCLDWKPDTASMTAQQFRLSLAGYAADAVAHRASGLLVDTTDFRFTNPAVVEEWRQQTVIPLYNLAGVQRMAYVFPGEGSLPPTRPRSKSERFETRYFRTRNEALGWLRD